MYSLSIKDLGLLRECILFCVEKREKIWGVSEENIENLLGALDRGLEEQEEYIVTGEYNE